MRAIYDWKAENAYQLSFKAGDILTVVNHISEHSWQASNSKGDYGEIPANFVEELAGESSKFVNHFYNKGKWRSYYVQFSVHESYISFFWKGIEEATDKFSEPANVEESGLSSNRKEELDIKSSSKSFTTHSTSTSTFNADTSLHLPGYEHLDPKTISGTDFTSNLTSSRGEFIK